jgi:hypothetical protein
MARWATTIVIAGVSLTGCRGEIVDASTFASPHQGSVEWAADGTPHPQVIEVGKVGKQFGIQMVSTKTTDLQSVLEAIRDAEADLDTFVVHIVDELYDINVNVFQDYTQSPFTHGQPASGYTPNVLFRFVVHSEVTL